MNLIDFNNLPPAEAVVLMRPCVDIPRWVDAIVAARPFDSEPELLSFAQKAAEPWTETEIDGALVHHPRIGERAAGSSTESTMSRSEQAGLEATDETSAQLAAGNRAYDHRFGRVFLIRAAGRSSADILAALQERLSHTPEQELRVIAEQLREIAILRLTATLQLQGATPA